MSFYVKPSSDIFIKYLFGSVGNDIFINRILFYWSEIYAGQLKKDDDIEILDKTDIKLKVDKSENYWYKVKTKNGKMGLVYGDLIKEN